MRNGTGGFPRWSRASTGSGCKPGDHLVTALQNNWQAATIHWACQFAGIIITPLNWRSTADELDYCLANAEAKALVYEAVSADAVKASAEAGKRQKIAVGIAGRTSRSRRWSRPTRRTRSRAPMPTPGR